MKCSDRKFGLSGYTLDIFFDKVVRTYAGCPALAAAGETPFTYAEFGERVRSLRQGPAARGIRKGDKIAILGTGSPNWGVAFLAVTTMGAVAVPVMEDFPESDIDHILAHSDAVAIFISAALHQSLNLNNLKKLSHVIRLDDFASLSGNDGDDVLWAQIQRLPKRIMRSISKPSPAEAPGPGEDDLAEILADVAVTRIPGEGHPLLEGAPGGDALPEVLDRPFGRRDDQAGRQEESRKRESRREGPDPGRLGHGATPSGIHNKRGTESQRAEGGIDATARHRPGPRPRAPRTVISF